MNNIAGTLVSTDCFKKVNNKETTFNEVYSETSDKILQLIDYGHSESPSMVSKITNKLIATATEWQNRMLGNNNLYN